jgi:hypothetical protein
MGHGVTGNERRGLTLALVMLGIAAPGLHVLVGTRNSSGDMVQPPSERPSPCSRAALLWFLGLAPVTLGSTSALPLACKALLTVTCGGAAANVAKGAGEPEECPAPAPHPVCDPDTSSVQVHRLTSMTTVAPGPHSTIRISI